MGQNMALGLIIFLLCSVCNTSSEGIIPASRLNKCGESFHKDMLGSLTEALQNCDPYEESTKMKPFKENILKKKKTDSAQACHSLCYAHNECVAFMWREDTMNCHVLKKIGMCKKIKNCRTTYKFGMKDVCNENIGDDIKNYFSDPKRQQKAAKESFLQAKRSFDGTVESRKYYSKETKCLNALIEYGAISEEEMGIAPALKENNEVPFLPLPGETPTAFTYHITANSGPQKIPGINQKVTYKNWIITGFYAPPGKIISVTSPTMLLNKFKIKIGAHNDKNYKKTAMKRDPDITMDFKITKENQAIGSPYGGLIFILFDDNSFDGTTHEMKFENVLKAPHFIFGRHTNEVWNDHIKTEAIPWTVFEIPNKIGFVIPSRGKNGAYQLDDVTFNLNEWSDYMDKNDEAAGIVNRPAAELIVLDSQILVGAAHNGYPIMKAGLGARLFPETTINNVNFIIGPGHEIGHNMQLTPYLLAHVSVNIIFNYALPETRKNSGKCGTWGRGSRLFSYIKAGKPVDFQYQDDDDEEFEHEDEDGDTESDDHYISDCIWAEALKMPFDGLDGSGWNDLPAIFAPYRELPTRKRNSTGPTWRTREKMDLWVKTFCQVKEMNMLPYFQFWNFFITESTTSICNGFSDTPTDIMSWIEHLENLAQEDQACPGEGWFGTSEKCFKISEEQYKYQGAVDYCKDNSASLATITGEDDVILVNYAFLKSSLNGVWIQSVEYPSALFPYAKDSIISQFPDATDSIISTQNTKVILGKYKGNCHYKDTAKAGENRNCVAPAKRYWKKKTFALCEKTI